MLENILEKVWDPVKKRTGYTPYSTAFMAVVFVLFVEAYWKLVKKFDQKGLRRAAVPWFFLAGLVRFADSRVLPASLLTITPGIFAVIIVAFTISLFTLDFERTRKLGIFLSLVFLFLDLPFLRFSRSLYLVPVALICYGVWKVYIRFDFMKDSFAWMPHIFEAWITSFGVYAGLIEEHVLAGILMGFNPFLFGVVKTLVIPLIMYLIKDLEGEQKLYIGSVIGALGLGPGVRDMLELLSL